jgi:hypothetical protein
MRSASRLPFFDTPRTTYDRVSTGGPGGCGAGPAAPAVGVAGPFFDALGVLTPLGGAIVRGTSCEFVSVSVKVTRSPGAGRVSFFY